MASGKPLHSQKTPAAQRILLILSQVSVWTTHRDSKHLDPHDGICDISVHGSGILQPPTMPGNRGIR